VITDYHSKFIAADLKRRRASDSSEKLAVAVAGAQVDMNPHQVDAALFAFASTLALPVQDDQKFSASPEF